METSPVSAEGAFSVIFKIKNTSQVPGREVAQVYICDPQASLPRPVKELKGFVKIALDGGETQTVKVDLAREALGFYDDQHTCWVAEKGTFKVLVATSSSDIRLEGEVHLDVTFTWMGL
jgi:beta-glucosidase